MRQATLGLFYIVKYLELIFLFFWTGWLISSGVYFIDLITEQVDIESKDQQCIIFTAISLVLVLWNLFYNNLLINLRFLTKMRCVTFGLCVFDAFNYLFCYCFLAKPCRDKCFTPWTLIKWLIKGGIMGYTVYLVMDKKDRWGENQDVGQFTDWPSMTNFDIYLIIYLVQHPIFIVSRFPIFLLYTILTCCCDKGAEFDDNEEFQDRILSFDFVAYELGRLNNFQNHPIGRNEFEYNRRLSFVRAQSIRQRPEAVAPPSQSIFERAQNRLGGTIYATLGPNKTGECSICFLQMQAGEKIAQLACHETHQFHDQCYNNFITHNANNPNLKLCPLCRVRIDEGKVVKKVYHDAKPADMKIEDAFGLAGADVKKMDNLAGSPEVGQNQMTQNQLIMPPGGEPVPMVMAPINPSADANQQELQGPNRAGTVHIEELPVPPRIGDDDLPPDIE